MSEMIPEVKRYVLAHKKETYVIAKIHRVKDKHETGNSVVVDKTKTEILLKHAYETMKLADLGKLQSVSIAYDNGKGKWLPQLAICYVNCDENGKLSFALYSNRQKKFVSVRQRGFEYMLRRWIDDEIHRANRFYAHALELYSKTHQLKKVETREDYIRTYKGSLAYTLYKSGFDLFPKRLSKFEEPETPEHRYQRWLKNPNGFGK